MRKAIAGLMQLQRVPPSLAGGEVVAV